MTPAARATSAASRAVEWPVSAARVGLLGEERAVVDEQVGVDGGLEDRARRPGVAGEDDPPPAPSGRRARRRAARPLPSGSVTSSPRWSAPKSGPDGTPEPRRGLDVEAARALLLDERVADRRGAVVDLNRLDRVVAALDLLAGAELDEPVRVRELAEDPRERAEEILEPARAVHGQRRLAPAERERLHQAGQPEVWSAWKCVRKTSSTSTSPIDERSSWRCVPSPQSKSSRSPPRRRSSAEGARRAVGTEPDVPRKTRSRSTRQV